MIYLNIANSMIFNLGIIIFSIKVYNWICCQYFQIGVVMPLLVNTFQAVLDIMTDPQWRDSAGVSVASVLFFEIIALWSLVSFTDFPQLNGLICQKIKHAFQSQKHSKCRVHMFP